ncbi:MAG: ABC transporter substrate-binding protein [Deltaproteobacteria bacterium]|nr:MAG: ABC transporter substrate-binding protein [Deltaproteobacteria bacterium]
MRRRSWMKMVMALVVTVLAGASAHAAAPDGEAAAAPADGDAKILGPKERIDEVYATIAKATQTVSTQDELVEALTSTLDDLMDYEAFAKRTLKTSWPNLTKAQRDTFMDRFKKLVVVVYAKRFKPRTAFEVGWREDGVKYRSEEKKQAKVLSVITGSSVSADVDYYMNLGGTAAKDRWFVYDFEIDKVSMALNWRRRFESIIKKDGFDALIAKIQSRIDRDEDED